MAKPAQNRTGRDPAGLVLREPLHRHAPAGLVLERAIGQRLARRSDAREAFGVFLNAPRRREVALSHGQAGSEPHALARVADFNVGGLGWLGHGARRYSSALR